MKKLVITLTALFALGMGAWAESSQHKGAMNIEGILLWKLPAGGGTMTIYGDEYQPMRNYTSAADNLRHFATSEVGPKVKSIDMQKGFNVGNYAFSQLDSLESVTLHGTPSDVRYFPIFHIGDYAFAGSSKLASINSKNLTDLRYIGTNAFAGTAIKTFTINKPAGRELPQYAKQEGGFPVDLNREHCYIGENAFNSQCLNTVYMKDDTPFSDTYNNFLNDYAYLVVNNADVAATYRDAWPEISSRIVYLEETVPFANEEVKEICVNKWDTNGDGELSYEEIFAVTDFGDAFAGNTTITKIDGLEPFVNVTVIGSGTFSGCTALESITIPPHITDIADDAFTGCTNLKEIHFVNKTPQMEDFTVQTNERTHIIVPDAYLPTYDALWTDKSELIIGESHIPFQCPEAKRLCVVNWDKDKDGELSYTEARTAAVIYTNYNEKKTQIYDKVEKFSGNTKITSFNEFRFFTGHNSIANGFFNGCSNLRSITIPENITNIASSEFSGCGLYTFIIEDSQTPLSIAKFDGNGHALVSIACIKDIYIGRNIKTSNTAIFESRPGRIINVTIGKYVTDIPSTWVRGGADNVYISSIESWLGISLGSSASTPVRSNGKVYVGGEIINNLTLPDTITEIRPYTFMNWRDLEVVSIPDGVTSIGTQAFENCSSLKNIIFPEGLTSIGENAFYGCKSLLSITIPSSVDTIGSNSFEGISGSITFESGTPITYNSYSSTAVYVVPDDAVESYQTAWANIAPRIMGKSGLEWKEVTLEAQPTSSHLTELIGKGNELNVLKLRIRGTINSYDMMVMQKKMQNLRELDLTNATIVANSYNYGTGVSENNVFPDFMKGKYLYNLLLPTSITTIGSNALNDCDYIETITIPDNVTSIGNNAFDNCSRLSNVYITNESKLQTIEGYAFQESGLKNVDFSKAQQLETIGEGAFLKSSISSISLPTSLKTIGNAAFGSCANLYSLTTTANIGNRAFINCTNLHSLTIANIGYQAFQGCSALKSVTIEGGATSIGDNAFEGLNSLETVNIGKGVKKISKNAFKGCSGLKTVSLPESLNSLDTYAFSGCTALQSITIPDAVTSLGTYAFNGCTALEKAEIGMGVTSVPQNLFSGCTKLKDVKLSPKTTTIQSNAFQNCTGLTEFHLPPYLTSIASGAFSGCNNLTEIYAYMPDVPTIAVSTFSNYSTSTLYAPAFLFNAYYYDSGWNQFLYVKRCDLRPGDYEAFYTNKDLYFKEGEERITHDRPIVELGNQGSIIVEGAEQEFTTVDMLRGETSSSLIGDDNIVMDELRVKINVDAKCWYFLCFPYDVNISECTYPGKYAWRYYDGAARAANGNGGWQKIQGDVLKAGVGYIFQSNTAGNLIVKFADPEFGGDRPTTLQAHGSTNAANASWNFVGNPYACYYNLVSDDFASPITVWNGSTYVAYRPGDDNYHLQPYEAFFVQKTEDASAINFKAEGRETYSQSVATAAAQTRASFQRSITNNRFIVNLTISDNDTAAIDRTRLVMNNKASCNYELACDASKFISEDAAAQIYTLEGSVKMAINERPGQGKVRIGYTAQKAGKLRIEAQRMDSPMELLDTKTNRTFDLAQGAYEFTTEAGTFDNRFVICTSRGADEINNLTAATGVVIGMQEGGLNIGGAADKLVAIYGTNGTLVAEQYGNGYVALPSGIYVVKVDGHSAKMYVK